MNNLKLKIWIVTRVTRAINRMLPYDASGEKYDQVYDKFLKAVNNMSDVCILEIGSRNETNSIQRNLFTSAKEYTGFDYYAGENVDVVGDAHNLSQYLPEEHYDAVLCMATFEHLAMPWKTVLEINKVIKKGALVFINTHPAYPPHNRPWDFWRFQKASFNSLLNEKTGFRIIDCEEGDPASLVVYNKRTFKSHRSFPKRTVNLGVSVIAEKIGLPDNGLSWAVEVKDMIDGVYPQPKI